MEKSKEVLGIFEKYTPLVDAEIKELLSARENFEIYDMMRYFFGYLDEDLKEAEGYGGKRFRPGIALLLADFYGTSDKALEVATAIEVFHNFTLIHDDIEDNDPMRRGRPTVWKKWGVAHGINAGDAQLVLAYSELEKGEPNYGSSFEPIRPFLNNVFMQVTEGQFLDFTLAEKTISDPFVTEENYLDMIKRKSGVLVAASARVAGMVAGKTKEECELLWQYGLNLGLAYQLNDDLVSIWGDFEHTGKVELNDLKEKKKTLPILFLYQKLDEDLKLKFTEIYDKSGELSEKEVAVVKEMLSENEAHKYTWEKIEKYLNLSNEAIAKLSINDTDKETLKQISAALIPDMKWWNA